MILTVQLKYYAQLPSLYGQQSVMLINSPLTFHYQAYNSHFYSLITILFLRDSSNSLIPSKRILTLSCAVPITWTLKFAIDSHKFVGISFCQKYYCLLPALEFCSKKFICITLTQYCIISLHE